MIFADLLVTFGYSSINWFQIWFMGTIYVYKFGCIWELFFGDPFLTFCWPLVNFSTNLHEIWYLGIIFINKFLYIYQVDTYLHKWNCVPNPKGIYGCLNFFSVSYLQFYSELQKTNQRNIYFLWLLWLIIFEMFWKYNFFETIIFFAIVILFFLKS